MGSARKPINLSLYEKAKADDHQLEDTPNLEFGAFRRPGKTPTSSRPTSRYASPSPTRAEARPIIQNGKVIQVDSRKMRAGAPRLGGLGLGGAVARSAGPTPPASPTKPSPPASPQRIKRKPSPSVDSLFKLAASESQHPAAAAPPSTSTSVVPPINTKAPIERPFLSPELPGKPTPREGDFALDRIVPEATSSVVTEAPPDPPDSPGSPEAAFDQLLNLGDSPEPANTIWSEQKFVVEELQMEREPTEGQEPPVENTEFDGQHESTSASPPSPLDDTPSTPPDETFDSAPMPSQLSTSSSSTLSASQKAARFLEDLLAASRARNLADPPSTTTSEAPMEEFQEEEEPLGGRMSAEDVELPVSRSDSGSGSSEAGSSLFDARSARSESRSRSRGPPPPRPARLRPSSASPPPSRTPAPAPMVIEIPPADADTSFEDTDDSHHSAPPSPTSTTMSDSSNDEFFFSSPPTPTFTDDTVFSPQTYDTKELEEDEEVLEVVEPQVDATPAAMNQRRRSSYKSLGLRLPSSLLPQDYRDDEEDSDVDGPPAPTTVPATQFRPVTPPEIPPATVEMQEESCILDVSSPVSTPPLDASSFDASSLDSRSLDAQSLEPSTSISHEVTDSPHTAQRTIEAVTEDQELPAASDPSLEKILAGAVFSGGMAVGWGAWRGLTTVANAGWEVWNRGAKVIDEPQGAEVIQEEREEVVTTNDVDAEERENVSSIGDDVESSIMSTEWGDVHFPAPKGFVEDLKQAMLEVGEEDLAASDEMAAQAQIIAYESAQRVHDDESSIISRRSSVYSTGPFPTIPKSPGTRSAVNRRREKLSPRGATRITDSLDDIAEMLSNEAQQPRSRMAPSSPSLESPGQDSVLDLTQFIDAVPDVRRHSIGPRPVASYFATEPSRLGSPTLAASPTLTATSTFSSRTEPPNSPALVRTPSGKQPSKRKSGIFSFGRTKSPKEPTPSFSPEPEPATRQRARSIDSGSSSVSATQSPSARRHSFFGGSRPQKMNSIDSEISDHSYVDYGSLRRRSMSQASDIPPVPAIPALPVSQTATPRRSCLRQDSKDRRRDSVHSAMMDPDRSVFSVRFGNVPSGLGLRSVAEDEAAKAGGEDFGVKWVGVGRGRYGNLQLKVDEATDETYAEQVAVIKKKWRSFGSGPRDWSAIKVD